MDPVTVAAQAISPLIKAFIFALKVYDVKEDAAVLENLAHLVEKDLEYARACRQMQRDTLRDHKLHRDWVVKTIMVANTALEDFRACLLTAQASDGKQPELHHKLAYLIFKHEKTIDLEKALRAAHSSLLVAISLMHQLASAGGALRPPHPSRRGSTPRSRPRTVLNRIPRASNHEKASQDSAASPSEGEEM